MVPPGYHQGTGVPGVAGEETANTLSPVCVTVEGKDANRDANSGRSEIHLSHEQLARSQDHQES